MGVGGGGWGGAGEGLRGRESMLLPSRFCSIREVLGGLGFLRSTPNTFIFLL